MDLTWRFDVESGFDKIHDMEWTLAENVISIQILTAHDRNGGKLLSRGENQPWPTIHWGP